MHPGAILLEEFIEPLGLTQRTVAASIDVPEWLVDELVRGRRRVDAETALRLGRYLGTTAEFWMHLQGYFDLELERGALAEALSAIVPLRREPVAASGPQA